MMMLADTNFPIDRLTVNQECSICMFFRIEAQLK